MGALVILQSYPTLILLLVIKVLGNYKSTIVKSVGSSCLILLILIICLVLVKAIGINNFLHF